MKSETYTVTLTVEVTDWRGDEREDTRAKLRERAVTDAIARAHGASPYPGIDLAIRLVRVRGQR